jgi:hypothetical protein
MPGALLWQPGEQRAYLWTLVQSEGDVEHIDWMDRFKSRNLEEFLMGPACLDDRFGAKVARMKTRRDALLGAATLAFRPTGVKLSVSADPIVPAIARHRAAVAAYADAPSDETHADAADAFDQLCATEPTTLPGLKMFADQLVEEFDGEWAGDIDTFEIALTTLRNALPSSRPGSRSLEIKTTKGSAPTQRMGKKGEAGVRDVRYARPVDMDHGWASTEFATLPSPNIGGTAFVAASSHNPTPISESAVWPRECVDAFPAAQSSSLFRQSELTSAGPDRSGSTNFPQSDTAVRSTA